jgi:hypothetical protein
MTKQLYNTDIQGLSEEDRIILSALNGKRNGKSKRKILGLVNDWISIRDKEDNDRRKNEERILVTLLNEEMTDWERNKITGEVVKIMTTIKQNYGDKVEVPWDKQENGSENGIPGAAARIPVIHKFWYLEGEE